MNDITDIKYWVTVELKKLNAQSGGLCTCTTAKMQCVDSTGYS